KIDVDDLRARNPDIIVARGSGQGPKGPDAELGGYDGASFWARGGVAEVMPPRPDGWPMSQPSPAFGDVMAGMSMAGAIAAALVKRERTGEPSVVDVSLLGTAMWQISPLVVASKLFGMSRIPMGDRRQSFNPVVGAYKTKDERYIAIMLLQSDKFWPELCVRIGKPAMMTDARFKDSSARAASPAQFDETAVEVTRAPEFGEHTELTLVDLGYDWDTIAKLKDAGAIG